MAASNKPAKSKKREYSSTDIGLGIRVNKSKSGTGISVGVIPNKRIAIGPTGLRLTTAGPKKAKKTEK